MPFLPALSPSLGLGLLKAELAADGVAADLAHPDLAFLRRMADRDGVAAAIFDYKLVASSTDLGETVFAAALWEEEALRAKARTALATLLASGRRELDNDLVSGAVMRLLELPDIVEPFFEEVLASRDWGAYGTVGFSTVFSQSVASLALARRLKRRWPTLSILFGGPNVDGDMGLQMMRSFPFVDGVLRGEADRTLPALMSLGAAPLRDAPRTALDAVPGLVRRVDGNLRESITARPVTALNALPHPDYSDWFEALGALSFGPDLADGVALPIETSRGCWWGAVRHCVFCGLNPTTMAFRAKSPDRAVSEFDALARRWNVRRFFAVDNILDMGYFRRVLPRLEGLGYDIFYETKSNLNEAHVAQLARAGVRRIQPGIEGLDTRLLRKMDKGSKGHHSIEILKWCRIHGVDPLWFYLYGFPNETASPYLDDVAMMPRLWHLPPPRNPNPIVLDRYSPLYRDRETLGIDNVRASQNSAIYFAGLSEAARTELAYHFDAEMPGNAQTEYVRALWSGVAKWRARYEAGAELWQSVGDSVTLVRDARGPGMLRTTLLVGRAHRLNAGLRTARDPSQVQIDAGAFTTAYVDLPLTMRAAMLGAEVVDPVDRETALAALVERGFVVATGGLHLALALDEPTPAAPDRAGGAMEAPAMAIAENDR